MVLYKYPMGLCRERLNKKGIAFPLGCITSFIFFSNFVLEVFVAFNLML